MPSMPVKSLEFVETPETQFWQQCRERAERLGIPAWLLAEEGFVHEPVDTRSKSR